MSGLHLRITKYFVISAFCILFLASAIIAIEIHYHLAMFQNESAHSQAMNPLSHHLERALLSSLLYTVIGVFLLVMIVSYFVAKKMSTPLVRMRYAAEQMAGGNWEVRTEMRGDDEVSELGKSLNQLAEQLQAQESVRKQMTSDIAHELRTPLSTLKSHMEAFEDGVWEPTAERLSSCTEEINRLIHLIEDFDRLNDVEAPQFTLQKEHIDISGIIMKAIEAVQATAIQKNIKIQTKLHPFFLAADRERMIQVLLNILTNSLAYTPRGGQIEVAVEEKSGYALLSIRDNGEGMSKEGVQRAFERLYRDDPSRNRRSGGSGLGLSIVKRLVEAHSGEVWIESSKGEGTAVFITLPLGKG
ncbi:sensor histidine kinase [Priestia koreensis]|uniref:sensor histidine kinase n=1 Tax=Priestia koreensis TaxID=284581 RepID=UPI001F597154|nr:ATP-binding protein [Priestia koreensis]UNL83441.1 HAMP domain-containing protein [Priestia koreensis]